MLLGTLVFIQRNIKKMRNGRYFFKGGDPVLYTLTGSFGVWKFFCRGQYIHCEVEASELKYFFAVGCKALLAGLNSLTSSAMCAMQNRPVNTASAALMTLAAFDDEYSTQSMPATGIR